MLKIVATILCLMVLIYGLIGCQPKLLLISEYGYYELPVAFPRIENPEGNDLTTLRIQLGRKLFYDPILSRDSTISCANCHKQQFAFADTVPVSFGVEQRLGTQNAPSLANVGYAPYFTRAGGVPTLEMQILVPLQETHEFDFNIVLAAERMAKSNEYVELSKAAYERSPDPFVITRSIAAFERTLLATHSPYDDYVYYKKKKALTKAAKRGMDLFMSNKTNCSSCHTAPHFSDFSFKNNGLYEVYPDSGRMRFSLKEEDRDLFKVPSLRNIELTAPYMHDGSIQTLKEVIEHYNKGGNPNAHKSELIRPLGLSEKEQQDLLAFLKALTDESFIRNPAFSDPFIKNEKLKNH